MECSHGPIADMALKCEGVLATHSKALVSISGGADSDVMVDVCERVRSVVKCQVSYVWFDTGLEYRATKRHLRYLEERYGIEILRRRAEKTIPVSCGEFGQPFLSKLVSDRCERLQGSGFAWIDEPYEVLIEKHPRCTTGIKWWCNQNTKSDEPGWFDIGRNRWLKEYMVENPPTFPISAKCCDYAKKRVSRRMETEGGYDVVLVGVRKAEGGVRSTHGTCFDKGHGIDTYRPLFWLSDADKEAYVRLFRIRRSDCYELWGFERTGCTGCPFNRNVVANLEVVERYEPALAMAARRVFAESHEYTRQYREYVRERKSGGQMALFF